MSIHKSRIIFIHSLNNYTGSPNILSVVIKGLLRQGYQAELITSHTKGFLCDIPGLKYRYTCYHWSNNPIITLLLLLISQIELFFRVLFYSQKHIYYINTIVPFGALLACRLTRKRLIIHIHENMRQRKPIYIIFRLAYRLCNTKSIFVSNYLKETAVNCREGRVIHNSLPQDFFRTAETFLQKKDSEKKETVLMIASQRRFKGIYEFTELARAMPQYRFELVLCSDKSEIEVFKKKIGVIKNLKVYPVQKNLHPFYQRAKLLLQLSHPESWIETFGLTILEAMAYGIPVISPNVGGPVELVEYGENGYTVNVHETIIIQEKIEQLMGDSKRYDHFSAKALLKAQEFKEEIMIHKIEEYIR